MDRRGFLRSLWIAPVAAVAAIKLPPEPTTELAEVKELHVHEPITINGDNVTLTGMHIVASSTAVQINGPTRKWWKA